MSDSPQRAMKTAVGIWPLCVLVAGVISLLHALPMGVGRQYVQRVALEEWSHHSTSAGAWTHPPADALLRTSTITNPARPYRIVADSKLTLPPFHLQFLYSCDMQYHDTVHDDETGTLNYRARRLCLVIILIIPQPVMLFYLYDAVAISFS